MAREIVYGQIVENLHRQGDRFSRERDFASATFYLGRALQLCSHAYAPESQTRQAHIGRIRRSMGLLGIRRAVTDISRADQRFDTAESHLRTSREILGQLREELRDDPLRSEDYDHISTELGATISTKGRLEVAKAVMLNQDELLGQAVGDFRTARELITTSTYHTVMNLAHLARAQVLGGDSAVNDTLRQASDTFGQTRREDLLESDMLEAAVALGGARLSISEGTERTRQLIRQGDI